MPARAALLISAGLARAEDSSYEAERAKALKNPYANDFGPASIDGWLTDVAAREMLIDNDPLLDPEMLARWLDRLQAAGIAQLAKEAASAAMAEETEGLSGLNAEPDAAGATPPQEDGSASPPTVDEP